MKFLMKNMFRIGLALALVTLLNGARMAQAQTGSATPTGTTADSSPSTSIFDSIWTSLSTMFSASGGGGTCPKIICGGSGQDPDK